MEEAIRQLSQLILPLVNTNGAPSSGVSHLLTSIKPLCILMAFNLVSLLLLSAILKITIRVVSMALSALNSSLMLIHRAIRRHRKHEKPREQKRQERRHAEIFEDEAWETESDYQWCGKDWTRQDASSNTQDKAHDALCEAFITLGLKPSASEEEIRSAYRRLIKRYHPDLYMKASPAEQERVNHIIVRVRHAYDLLTREGTNLH